MKYCSASPLPPVQPIDSCTQQDQEGEDFEPPEDHQEAREDLDPAGQEQEVLAAVEERHDGARARQAADGEAHGGQGVDVSEREAERREDQYDDVEEEEAQDPAVEFVRHGFAVDLDVDDHARVNRAQDFRLCHLDEHEQAHHLEAAADRADRRAERGEKQQHGMRKGRPGGERRGGKARRRRERDGVEEAHAKAVLDIVDADDGEVAGERRAARAYDEEEEAQFRIGKERAHVAPRRRPLPQEEVHAREQHRGLRREFRRDAASLQHEAARVESRRRYGSQGEHGARQETLACEQEEPEREERQAGVEERHLLRGRIHAAQERAEVRALLH